MAMMAPVINVPSLEIARPLSMVLIADESWFRINSQCDDGEKTLSGIYGP